MHMIWIDLVDWSSNQQSIQIRPTHAQFSVFDTRTSRKVPRTQNTDTFAQCKHRHTNTPRSIYLIIKYHPHTERIIAVYAVFCALADAYFDCDSFNVPITFECYEVSKPKAKYAHTKNSTCATPFSEFDFGSERNRMVKKTRIILILVDER